jgi:asparagine synthase (glutamine-hydrolysing)
MNIQQIINNELIQTKRVLRAAFKDKIPDNILNRPKMSFPVPFMSWFKDKAWQELSNEAIRSSCLYNTFIKGQIADSLLANPEDANIAFALWPVVNLCLWANQFDISL